MADTADMSAARSSACDREIHSTYAGPERRRASRRPQSVQAVIAPASGDTIVQEPVTVRDLSLDGVGFRAPHRYACGALYRITLSSGPLFLNARLRIVACRKRRDGSHDVGGAFC